MGVSNATPTSGLDGAGLDHPVRGSVNAPDVRVQLEAPSGQCPDVHDEVLSGTDSTGEGHLPPWTASPGILQAGLSPEVSLPPQVGNPQPERYFSDRYVVLDFEIDTSYGDFGHPVRPENQMLLACWECGGTSKVAWADEFHLEELIADIEEADFLVAHNAKYELGWLARCGLDVANTLVFDTKIAEYVLSGNLSSLTNFSTSLDDCCIRRGWQPKDPVVDHMMRDGVNPVRMPRAWLQGRCEQDVRSTRDLFLDQRARLDRQGMLPVLYTRCLLTPILAIMEMNGMALDTDRVLEEHERATKQLHQAEAEWRVLTGGVNSNSPKQMAELLYEKLGFEEPKTKTASGKPATDIKTVEKLPATTAEQKKFVKVYQSLNQASTELSKNLDFFKGVVEEDGGVFYAQFNQTVTSTHRLSSSGLERKFKQFDFKPKRVQFQNLPRRFKRLFKAREEGWFFTEWDGSGLEFRGAGLISQDEMIKRDITDEHFDPHRHSASVIYGVSEEEVTSKQRTAAKAHTFKPLFGGQSGTRAEKRYYKSFNERYSGLVTEQERWVAEVINSKSLRTPWGLTFRFPYVKIDPDGYVNVKTNIYNYPIQAICTAEIIPLALVAFYHLVRAQGVEDKVRLVNTVHDSVLCEVHESAVEEYRAAALGCWYFVYWYFENVYGFPLQGLPLGTELVIGTHWSEGDEQSYNLHQDGRIE